MDSGMYLASEDTTWLNLIPDFALMSSSCGTGRLWHLTALAPGGGAEPWATPCARVSTGTAKEVIRMRRNARTTMGRKSVIGRAIRMVSLISLYICSE